MATAADRRAFLAAEWREVQATDAGVATMHLLAQQIAEDTLLTQAADAQTEATRREGLRSVMRDRFELTVPLDDTTAAIDLGDVVTVTHARFGLTGGATFRVIGIAPDAMAAAVTFTLWGQYGDPARYTEDDEVRLTEDGETRDVEA